MPDGLVGLRQQWGEAQMLVEMGADELIELIDGSLEWEDGIADGRITASGERSDLSALFRQASQTIRIAE